MPSYSGVWNLTAVYQAVGAGQWPKPPIFPVIGAQADVASLQLQRAGIAPLSSTTAIYSYIEFNTGTGLGDLKAVVVTRSGSSLSFGTPITVRSNLSPQGVSICKLSATTAFVAYETSANNYLGGRVLSVSGTSLSAGTETVYSYVSQYPSVTRLSDTSAACAVLALGGLRIILASVSGTTFSWGGISASVAGVNAQISTSALSSTSVITVFDNSSSSNYPTAVVSTISGGSVTNGSPVQIESIQAAGTFMGISAMSSTSALAVWGTTSPSFYGKAVGMTISGTTITIGTPMTYSSETTTSSAIGSLQPITSTSSTTAYSVYKANSKTYVNKFILNGTSAVLDNTQEILSYSSYSPVISSLDASNIILGYGSSSPTISARILQL